MDEAIYLPLLGKGGPLAVDEAIYLVPVLPPHSPERDDPAKPDHKGENSRLSYQLSVISYEL